MSDATGAMAFLNQPMVLPPSLRQAVAERLPGERLLLYAMIDLDADMQFCEHWLILCEHHLIMAQPEVTHVIALASIDALVLRDGLSNHCLDILGDNQVRMQSLSFTRRQGRAVGDLRYVADLRRETPEAALDAATVGLDADTEYREAVLHSLEEARTFNTPTMGVMLRLLSYLRPHKKAVATGLALAALLTFLQLLPPYLSKVLVDDILRPVERGTLKEPGTYLWWVVGSLALVWTCSEVSSFFRLRLMAFTGEKVATRLRLDIYSHLQTLSLSFFSSRTTGSLITRVSSDTERLWEFVTFGVVEMIISVFQVVGVATALFLQDASLACLVLLPLPVMTAMFYWHSKKLRTLYLRIWRKWSAVTGVLSDVIPGIRVVKAFAQEAHEVQRFRAHNAALEQESETLHRQWTRFWPSVVMLMHTCSLIVWVVGAPRVLLYMQTGGKQGLPLGVFIAFTGYMWGFWAPVQHLGMMSRTVNRVATSASRVFEVLDAVPSIVSKPHAKVLSPLIGEVQFDHVTFSYDGIRSVLKDVSFAVRPGELVGLVGPSGGGKTTLVNLMCRFYDVKAGHVRLDQTDVRDLELTSLRRQIGLVLQEPYLFHGTISDNIAYGAQDADLTKIIGAARAANAHDFICGFPDGYETLVGERGQTLSGGERQRISIARAILHDPRVLILDEATSSVDTETEQKIQEALDRLVRGRTTFAIAHRLSTLSAADRLLVIEGGRLVEQGTHRELLENNDGVYTRLHRTQAQLHALIAV